MAPGTFWYDFLTGPALGGIGALAAALFIGAATLRVSRDRREDAAQDRAAERERTRREEWFRRVQWAQQLTGSQDLNTEAAGYYMLDHLGTSGLASSDDTRLLFRLTRTDELDAEASAPAAAVDASDYVVDDGEQARTEART